MVYGWPGDKIAPLSGKLMVIVVMTVILLSKIYQSEFFRIVQILFSIRQDLIPPQICVATSEKREKGSWTDGLKAVAEAAEWTQL